MGLFKNDTNGKSGKDLRQFSLLAAVPALLIAGPAVGFFIGQWADEKFGYESMFTIIGIILGFGAAGKEIYRLVKKAQSFENEKDNGKQV
jgi:F0F1-type ATP synthase assembly protein I